MDILARKSLLGVAALLLSGCVSTPSTTYTPPALYPYSNTVTIGSSFDETWDNLVTYASKSFFAIDNFEKDSGLMTLSFSASDAARYIDCGNIFVNSGRPFNGPYALYAQRYNGAGLTGIINLRVRTLTTDETEVAVNARYIFTVPGSTIRVLSSVATIPAVTWTFDSKSSDTRYIANPAPGTPPTRSCVATGAAETQILEGVQRPE